MANQRNGTLYTGSTRDLVRRVYEHKNKIGANFTRRYNTKMLVYYEECGNAETMVNREYRVKNWRRKWKLDLIERINPEWKDLYPEIL